MSNGERKKKGKEREKQFMTYLSRILVRREREGPTPLGEVRLTWGARWPGSQGRNGGEKATTQLMRRKREEKKEEIKGKATTFPSPST